MAIEQTMERALAARPDAVALVCMDTRSGLVLGMQVRGDVARDELESVAECAAELCSAPPTSGDIDAENRPADEAFVVSSRWVHAFARVPMRREILVVGLAPGDANVGLLRAWIRQVAQQVGPAG